ncbi:40S ribosomal protein S25-like [Triticum aestivum]|uniref:40S ribosomal protein S25-like n=1 Tax=Triticum aestivum TaxID=4565 RepID=UPI001D02E3C6|nr:40S ribosomal protein S25-like [Triticum aestivum]
MAGVGARCQKRLRQENACPDAQVARVWPPDTALPRLRCPHGVYANVKHAVCLGALPVFHSAVKKDNKAAASSSSAKPANAGSGKQQQKKKNWSKGKQKEKVNNAVLFDQATYDKLLSEAPKYKLVTPSVLSERLRINASLHGVPGGRGIKDLMARGLVREVSLHASQQIFTRATNVPSS